MSNPFPSSDHVLSRFRLDGRVAFLTGAAGHLGQSMAKALGEAGSHVILNGRRQGPLEILAGSLTAQGHKASVACFDVTGEKAVAEHIERIGESHGRLDILVNNASVGKAGTLETATAKDFDQIYRLNVIAPFQILQAAIPLLKASSSKNSGGASVVNIASMYGSVSPDPSIYGASGANNPPYYGAAKAGLIQLTRYAACHLAKSRIRVNCISPGPFPESQYLERDAGFREQLNAKNPMHRIGEPYELQGALIFLASDASSYVTGINLPVDGGWTAW